MSSSLLLLLLSQCVAIVPSSFHQVPANPSKFLEGYPDQKVHNEGSGGVAQLLKCYDNGNKNVDNSLIVNNDNSSLQKFRLEMVNIFLFFIAIMI